MVRRQTRNITRIPRIDGIPFHDAWAYFTCVSCRKENLVPIGMQLLSPDDAYEVAKWKCRHCGFMHEKGAPLPFTDWPKEAVKSGAMAAGRFWQAFFRTATENPASYWKQCNTCGRILPFNAFSRHAGWGPLERQMECRACKGAINAILNPRRTKEQLQEGSVRRRAADMLLEGENEKIDHRRLFRRFDSKCFKTGNPLKIKDRRSWAIDHILPSKYLYPLTTNNAALLSREANENKRDRWPSKFYTNTELIRLAQLTGADLTLLTSPEPILNPNIDVNACVQRTLQVREKSNLRKRILKLQQFLTNLNLVDRLSPKNKKLLGLD